jgi:hypothetical protein
MLIIPALGRLRPEIMNLRPVWASETLFQKKENLQQHYKNGKMTHFLPFEEFLPKTESDRGHQ